MSTRDIVQDIVKHTAGLGFITSVKVTGTDESTTLDAMDADRTVILQAKLHNTVDEFKGEFGLGNLGFLAGVTALPNYQTDDSTVEVVTRERNGVTSPDHLMFRDVEGNTDQYRFMSKEIIEQTLQTVKFKGVEWNITINPTVAAIQRLAYQAQVHAEEATFIAKTINNNLEFVFGDHSTHAGNFVFHPDVEGKLTHGWAWPVLQIQSILKLAGDKTMMISDSGAAQINVDSGLAVYEYILPAQSK